MKQYFVLHYRNPRVIMAFIGVMAILLSSCVGLQTKVDRFYNGEKGEVISLLRNSYVATGFWGTYGNPDYNKGLSLAYLADEKNQSIKDPYLQLWMDINLLLIYQKMGNTQQYVKYLGLVNLNKLKLWKDEGIANVVYNFGIIIYDLYDPNLDIFARQQSPSEINKGRNVIKGYFLSFVNEKRKQSKTKEEKLITNKFEKYGIDSINAIFYRDFQLLRQSKTNMIEIFSQIEDVGRKLGINIESDKKFLAVKKALPFVYDLFIAIIERNKSQFELSMRKSLEILNSFLEDLQKKENNKIDNSQTLENLDLQVESLPPFLQ